MHEKKDAISILVNFANNIQGAFTNLAFVLAGLFAVIGAIGYLSKHAGSSKAPGNSPSGGKVIAWLLLCGGLAGLDQMIVAAARQLGWQGVTFDAISYVDVGRFGAGALAANAMLSLVRVLGVFYCLNGMLSWRRSLKDGHTGLSASQDVSNGTLKFSMGVLAICSPYWLDALKKSFGML